MRLPGLIILTFMTWHLSAQIHVRFEGLRNESSQLYIALYDSTDVFLGDKRFFSAIIPVHDSVYHWQIDRLPLGTYAITVYQDINLNGKLDRGMFGKPTEPYGFSKNPPSGFRAPSFQECKFSYHQKEKQLVIRMR
jgi:uncharacterized protein (DUF2141 family)